MRLLQEVPEVEIKLQSGNLNLTQASMAKAHFREEKFTQLEKQEILVSIDNQSTKSTERILAERKPEPVVARPVESERSLRGQKIELTIVLDEELQKDLGEIQTLLGMPASKLELFRLMTRHTLERLRKKSKPEAKPQFSRKSNSNLTSVTLKTSDEGSSDQRKAQPLRSKGAAKSRYIPVAIRRKIHIRDRNCCQYKDSISGKQCDSNLYLQFEHMQPFAKGGENHLKNLQRLFANHNRLKAIQYFGSKKMQRFIPSIK
jgi:hypothetical protein